MALASAATEGWVRLRIAERALLPPAHQRLLWLLLMVSCILRMWWLVQPEGSLVFDEDYYVNSARVILAIPVDGDHYRDQPVGLDPNTEHPPLAKLIVAGSMRLLGDNPFGWRMPSVVLGTASILLLYGVSQRLGAGRDVALAAAGLFAFDNLVFVHSRIFTLDIYQLAFMLLGLYWYLSGRPILAGVGFALAALSKIGGAFGLGALTLYEVLRVVHGMAPWRQAWRPAAKRLLGLIVTFVFVFFVLLGFMDRLWVGYSNPLDHLRRIVGYGVDLRRPDGPSEIESYPWQWLWNDQQIPYMIVNQQTESDDGTILEQRPIVEFRGAMNPFVLQLWPLGLAFAGYAWWRRQPGHAIGTLALAWFACTYLPFWLATLLTQRISYLFYFLPTVPAVALAGGYFLLRSGLPRAVVWAYGVAVLLGFYGYFPFKFYGFSGS